MNKLIVFSAKWCGPCKAYHPILDEFKQKFPDLTIREIDVDSDDEEEMSLMKKYAIRSVPTTVLVDESDNKIKSKFGLLTLDNLTELINNE